MAYQIFTYTFQLIVVLIYVYNINCNKIAQSLREELEKLLVNPGGDV